VPTIAESGLPNFDTLHYTSMLVRTGTPQDIVNKLSENLQKAMKAPEVRDKLMQNGDIAQGTLTEASDLYAKEYKTWPGVVQKAGIKPT
jgi:tripartite-type tricarboxylate transporter receptor subunit TctC